MSCLLTKRDPLLPRPRAARESAETSKYRIEDAKMAASSLLALPTPAGPVRRRSGSRNRRRSPRAGRRALRGELDSCSFGFARIFSRAGPRLATPGPATPQGLPTGRPTSLLGGSGFFLIATYRIIRRAPKSLHLADQATFIGIALLKRIANDRTDLNSLRNAPLRHSQRRAPSLRSQNDRYNKRTAHAQPQPSCLSATPLF